MNLINKSAKILIAFLFIFIFNSLIFPVRSQTVSEEDSLSFDLNKLPKPCFSEDAVLAFPPLSQTEPSIPSLWLAQQLYGGKILQNWYIENSMVQLYPNLYLDSLVTLVVDRENWNAERYLGQYVFVNQFANITRGYGYNLRVCNLQGDLLAYYYCDFKTSPLNCQVQIRSTGLRRRDFQ